MEKAKIRLLSELLSEYIQSDEHFRAAKPARSEHYYKVLDELDMYFDNSQCDKAAIVLLSQDTAIAIQQWYYDMFGDSYAIGKNALNTAVTDTVFSHLTEDQTLTPFKHSVLIMDNVIGIK